MPVRTLFILMLCLMSWSCGDDNGSAGAQPLPVQPQLRLDSAFVIFPLTRSAAGTETEVDVVLVNGGQQPLEISDLTIQGRDAAFFSFPPDSPNPSPATAISGQAVSVRLQFAPDARGVFLAELLVTSNAENLPSAPIQLVGPGRSNDTAGSAAPYLAVWEDTTEALSTGQAFVRYFNLGDRSLGVTAYSLSDPEGAFSILAGTVSPTPEDPLFVGPGAFAVITVNYNPPASGTHDATFEIPWFDVDDSSQTTQNATVTISGTN